METVSQNCQLTCHSEPYYGIHEGRFEPFLSIDTSVDIQEISCSPWGWIYTLQSDSAF